MQKLQQRLLFFLMVILIITGCVNYNQEDKQQVINDSVDVSMNYVYKDSKPRLILTFVNKTDTDYMIQEWLYSCVEIENKKSKYEPWYHNEMWMESEQAISGIEMGTMDKEGNYEKQDLDDIINFQLVIPKHEKVIKMITAGFIESLIKDGREVRIRFKYDINFTMDINKPRSLRGEKLENAIVTGYYYLK